MRHIITISLLITTLGGIVLAWQVPAWWFTPAQQAARFFQQQQYQQAAEIASDPAQQGAAFYRASKFPEAAAAYARDPSAAGAYNRGNSFVMQGKYDDAIKSFDRALKLQPGWRNAEENRQLATIRRDRLKTKGGDDSGGQVTADDIVFEKGKAGETVQVDAGQPLNDTQLQAMWLRRVQTKPADFLRAKFAYQLSEETKE